MNQKDIPKHFLNETTQVRNMSDIKRTTHRIEPYNSQSFNTTSNRRLLFKLPRVGLLRGVNSYLRYDITVAGGSVNSAYEPFHRFKVRVGNQEIINEREYGMFKINQLKATIHTGQANSASIKATGEGNTQSDGVINEMCLPLAHVAYDKRSLFSELLPLYKMDQCELEWEVNDSLDQFTSGDATSVTINNCQLVLDIVDSPRLRQSFSTPIKRSIETFDHQVRNLPASSTKINEILPSSYQNIQAVFLFQRETADVSVGVTGGEYYSNLQLNSIDNVQLLLDGKPIPAQPIRFNTNATGLSGVENTKNLEECWGVPVLGSWLNWEDGNASDRAYVGVPCAAVRKAVSGIRTSNTSGNLRFTADVSNANTTQMDLYILYHKFLEISASGATKSSE